MVPMGQSSQMSGPPIGQSMQPARDREKSSSSVVCFPYYFALMFN